MKAKQTQKTVVVAMSGGVDSSLAAALLKEQGYAVIGVYMRNWSEPIKGVEHCPWVTDALDARQVAHQLRIPFYSVNFEAEYKRHVIESFLADTKAGRTPNPDILCNQWIKFDVFYKYALSLGADYIATGHYAQVKNGLLYKGTDPKKDQSYFLSAINSEVLPKVLFPIGQLQKSEVRTQAKKRGLVTAAKKDSQGICFIGAADVRDFVAQHLGRSPAFQPGDAVDLSGKIVGRHKGAGFYTIGQRAGISDVAWANNTARPILYVVATDVATNTITVGEDQDCYRDQLTASGLAWLAPPPQPGEQLGAKIRYGQQETPCVIVELLPKKVNVKFDSPQRAITPGQSIVFYRGEAVVGGGIIN